MVRRKAFAPEGVMARWIWAWVGRRGWCLDSSQARAGDRGSGLALPEVGGQAALDEEMVEFQLNCSQRGGQEALRVAPSDAKAGGGMSFIMSGNEHA